MQNSLRYGLLGGAALVAVAGIAFASLSGPSTSQAPLPQVRESQQDQTRGGSAKFFRDYDLDGDNTVTRNELDQAAQSRFAKAAGGADDVTAAQFEQVAAKDFRDRSDAQFRRIDWNHDAKVSLEEFTVPAHAEFQRLDRDAKATVSCATQRAQNAAQPPDRSGRTRRTGPRGGQSLAAFCRDNDLNKDGFVSTAELDQAIQQRFAAAAGSGRLLTPDALYALEAASFKDANARQFKRLDRNKDGKITKDEFVSRDTRAFARMDKNADGVVTRKEASTNQRRNKAARG